MLLERDIKSSGRRKHFGSTSGKRELTRKMSQDELHMDAQELQRSYGNQAIGRWSEEHDPNHSHADYAARGLRGIYEEIVMKYADAVDAEHAREWQRFSEMTIGQRQAVLVDMAGSVEHLEQLLHEPLDWMRLQKSMDTVEGVRLQPDEAEQEGNVLEPGEERMQSTVNVSGLLEPYRTIVIWLNYKAIKQGKESLMDRFERMSIPQKKIALHKMVAMQKLQFQAFADGMTVTFQEKQWIDWDKMIEAMEDVEKIVVDESDEQAVDEYIERMEEDEHEDLEKEELEEEPDEEKEVDDELDFLVPLLTTQETVQQKEQKSSTDFRTRLQEPDYLIWLLFGVKESISTLQKNAGRKVGVPEEIVDRFLNVSESSPQERTAARNKQLKEYGFQSMRQCYIYLLMSIVTHLYERGVVKKEEKFIIIIQLLGLFQNVTTLTKEQISQKLQSIE